MHICPVVLAGGSGTRLWPLSREQYPKQLLNIHGSETLLQQTVARLDGFSTWLEQRASPVPEDLSLGEPVVVCNEDYRFLIAQQLDAIGKGSSRILLEPVARNTAPALAIAAHAAAQDGDDPILLVMPADHVIRDLGAFYAAVLQGALLARQGMVSTFGIVPDRPESGYGYIKKGPRLDAGSDDRAVSCFAIDRFVEKPDSDTAQRYLDSGEYLWNSGMFVVRASIWKHALEELQPEMAAACREAFDQRDVDADFSRVQQQAFAACPADSIDYAVMERLADPRSGLADQGVGAAVIPLQAGWSDVGAWSAFWEIGDADADGNVKQGDVYAFGTHNSLLVAEHRLLATIGMDGVAVIETPDAVLVAAKDRAQDVKKVVDWLKTEKRGEGKTHRKVYRPWGSYECLEGGERYQVKRLTLLPGEAISLQMHHHRAEHWVVVRGTAQVTRGEEVFLLSENQSTHIPLGTTHRLENPGKVPLEIIEIQSGSYLGEDDITRFEDRYQRAETE